ncbi:MAG TPA: hypothetical protein VKZ63_20940, partial [Kofleriaceae bacterium]|nr:hypothetical protein [Kofleriaceae bacterium]
MGAGPVIAAAADPCRRCGTPLELADLRCCICALPAPAQASGARDERPVARVLRCQECAAAIAYAAEHQAPSCAFCGSVMEVEEPVDPVEEAELLLPFTVERDAARAALRRWLRSLGWFRPSDLSSSATIESLRPLHWAAWIFDADADVTWAADSDAGAGRSRWAPHAGSARFTWRDILVSASRGLTSRETSRLAGGYRLDSAVRIGEAGRAAGAGAIEDDAIEAFDTQRSAARRLIVSTVEGIAER